MDKMGNGNNRYRRWIDFLFFILGIAGLVWYISKYSTDFNRLQDVKLSQVGLILCVIILGHLFVSLKLQVMIRVFDKKVSLWECILLTEAGGFLNIIPLHLGTGLRATYLKKMKDLNFVDFSLGFLVTLFLDFMAAGIIGMASMPFLRIGVNKNWMVFIGYILLPVTLYVLAVIISRVQKVFGRQNTEKKNWIQNLLGSIIRGVHQITKRPVILFNLFLVNFVINLTLGLRFFLIGIVLGYDISVPSGMIMQSISRATALIAVIPAGTIGFREALTGIGAVMLEQPAITGVMISTIDRIIASIWIVSSGLISLFVVRARIKESFQSSDTT